MKQFTNQFNNFIDEIRLNSDIQRKIIKDRDRELRKKNIILHGIKENNGNSLKEFAVTEIKNRPEIDLESN